MISEEKRCGDLCFLEISERGANHRAMLLPNQDAIASLCVGEDFVLAVADGVGSCQKADLGSKAAVEACIDTFENITARRACFDSNIVVHSILNIWREKLEPVELDECCTTLKAVFKIGNVVKLVSLGDGFIAVSSDGINLLSPTESSSFTNETNCLCSHTRNEEFWVSDFRLDLYKSYAIICCTDGIANGLVMGSELNLVEEIEKRIALENIKTDVEDLVVDISNYCFDDKTIGVVKYERTN